MVPKRLVAKTLAVEAERKGWVTKGSEERELGRLGSVGSEGHSRQLDAHTRTLINDHNSVSITELEDLL